MRRPRTWVKLSSSPGRTSNEHTAGLEFQSSGKQERAKDRTRTTTVEHTRMTTSTARKRRPPQDGAEARPLRRAAGLILLFNGPARCPGARQTSQRRNACPRGQRGAVRRSAARAALVLRWTTRAGVGARSLPGARRTGGDERAALGPRLAWPGHPQLGFGTGDLHLLRVGAWPAATAALHRRCRLFERIPFLTVGHPAASCPPDSGRIPHPHRARWPDDHDGSCHLQLVLHSRAGHAAGVRDDALEGRVLSLPAGRHRADRLPDNTRIAT